MSKFLSKHLLLFLLLFNNQKKKKQLEQIINSLYYNLKFNNCIMKNVICYSFNKLYITICKTVLA